MTVLQSWLLILGCCAFCLLVLAPLCDRFVDWLEAHCDFYRKLGEAPTTRAGAIPHRRESENPVWAEPGRSSADSYSIIAFPLGVRRKR